MALRSASDRKRYHSTVWARSRQYMDPVVTSAGRHSTACSMCMASKTCSHFIPRKNTAHAKRYCLMHTRSLGYFIYGRSGATSALMGSKEDRALISDIMHPSRRKLSWCWVHIPAFTRWLYSRTGVMKRAVKNVLPMQMPTTYTAIRKHALDAFLTFKLQHQDAAHGNVSPELTFEGHEY